MAPAVKFVCQFRESLSAGGKLSGYTIPMLLCGSVTTL